MTIMLCYGTFNSPELNGHRPDSVAEVSSQIVHCSGRKDHSLLSLIQKEWKFTNLSCKSVGKR